MRLLAAVSATSVLLVLLAGCASDPDPVASVDDATSTAAPFHVLTGTVEPLAFDAPTFQTLGAVATGGPAYSTGEPSIRAALDGRLFVAFPGCDTPGSILVPVSAQGVEECQHGVVYRSDDDGTTWTRLNRQGDGRLSEDGPAANGDAEVAIDAAGVVYASNLGGGIQVHKSLDGGATWEFVANVVPENETADRQWMVAGASGHLIEAWMRTGPDARDVAINATFDGGLTWTGNSYLGDNIGWLGPVVLSPDGRFAYIVYTQPLPGGTDAVLLSQQECAVRVGRSADGGRTWEDLDTGARIVTNLQGGHWSCVNMAPALDVTGDGSVVAAWSEDVESPADLTAMGAIVKAVVSHDLGATWEPAFQLSTEETSIMPWVAGGAGNRFAVTYYANAVPADADYAAAVWDLKAVYVDGSGPDAPTQRVTIDDDVHEGGICGRGGACLLTGSDRFLLDFFQNDVLPDGRLVIAYPANPASGARFVEIRFAIQDGGTFLLERAD
ncbi:MAG: sialidase family protein [Candidatus Thermoplasmatota archaeon]|jgi:hypothetical protein